MNSATPATTESAAPILRLQNVDKLFGDFVAVERVNLDIREGEFFTIVGPSGSGKTTLIRMLVGMDKPSDGDILLRGTRINDVPANKRPTCMVFQSLALFPHKTVGQNIEFPLKIRGVPRRNGGAAASGFCSSSICRRTTTARPWASARAVSSSGWRWPAPWRPNPT